METMECRGQEDTPATLADLLRSAAGWCRLAAERLEDGDRGQAIAMAKLGLFGVEGMPDRIAGLDDEQEVDDETETDAVATP